VERNSWANKLALNVAANKIDSADGAHRLIIRENDID
jgi:hypothetical protein